MPDDAVPSRSLPFVSVIIPVFNDPERLEQCLNALDRQRYPHHSYEVIVVDNGSTPPLDLAARRGKANLRLTRELRPGSYAARNAGLEVARGAIVAFTDSDCLPGEDWIDSAVAHLARRPECGVLAGVVEVFARDAADPSAVELYDICFAFPQEQYVGNRCFGVTANLFVRRAVLEVVGGFDETLASGGDVEWGQRAAAAGYAPTYAADVRVAHPARHSFPDLVVKTRRVAYGQFLLLQSRRADRRSFWWGWLSPPLRKALRALTSPQLPSRLAGAKAAGIMVLVHYLHLAEVAGCYLRARRDSSSAPGAAVGIRSSSSKESGSRTAS